MKRTFGTLVLVVSMAAIVAVALVARSHGPLAAVLVGTGALWTAGLLGFEQQVRRDPGRFGLIGQTARAAGPMSAAIVCGLLTVLLVLFLHRERVGWPEAVVMIATLGFLLRWLLATIQLLRSTSRRRTRMRRKPEKWRPLR